MERKNIQAIKDTPDPICAKCDKLIHWATPVRAWIKRLCWECYIREEGRR